jgi:rhomboid protease GluP
MRLTTAPLTVALIVINIALYALDFFTNNRLSNAFALQPDLVQQGEWWLVITYGFMHGNWPHVLINMYALLQAGAFVEFCYGTPRYALIYFTALVTGGIAAYLTTVHSGVATVGASGAIMGVFGAMGALGFKLPRLRRELLQAAAIPIVLTLGYGLINPYVSNAGHIGGLIGGVLVALILTPARGQRLALQEEEMS